MSGTSRRPCPRRVKFAGAAVVKALALVVVVGVAPSAAPTFLPGNARTGLRQAQAQQSSLATHMKVLAGSRQALEPRGLSQVPMLAAYSSMKVVELKELCREKGLPVSGSKAVLISRLEQADGPEDVDAPEDDDGPEDVDESEEEEEQESPGKIVPGDRVMARYHRDHQMYPGIVLEQQDSETYLISWDEPDENEPLTSCKDIEFLKKAKKRLVPGKKQLYHVGDKVSARFAADNGFYEAKILELKGDIAKIEWKDPDGYEPIIDIKTNEIKLVLRAKSAC